MGKEERERNDRILRRTYESSANVSMLAMVTVAVIEVMMLVITVINKPLYGPLLWRYRMFYMILLTVVLLYIALTLYVKKDFKGRFGLLKVANPVSAVIFFAWSVIITYHDFVVLGTVDPTVFMTFSLSVPLCFYLLPYTYTVIAIAADLIMLYVCSKAPNGLGLVINMLIFFVFQFVLGLSLLRVKRGLSREIQIAEEQKDEIERLSSAQSRFFSSVSHEIRTPINAVLGMDELILRESREEGTLEYAENIRTAGTTLLELINDILDFSKMGAGKMEIIPVEYEISSILHDLVVMISVRAKDHNLEFFTKIDPEIPAQLFGDEVRIKQVITNILTNAVKYTEEGSVTFEVRSEKVDDENVELFVSVKDTGIGIKEEDIKKLYSAFERIEEKRNRNVEGTGLGMNITTNLLEMMGSRLEVDSVYGEGSDFHFVLRQKVVSWEPLGDFEKAWKSHLSDSKRPGFTFTAPNAVILAVDDMDMNLSVLTGLLKPTNIQIDLANSGEDCLRMITQKKYDLIYLDHRMPGMDGVETRKRMQTLDNNLNVDTPVVALTANAMAGAKEEYMGYGFTDYLSKPVSSASLEKSLRTHLPGDKILGAPEADMESDGGTNTDELPLIDGLDIEYAMLHLPDNDLFRTTVKNFRNVIDLQADKLEDMYKDFPSRTAFDAYRIQVHGMKSSAAIIGIIPLAGMAKVLENAAAANDKICIDSLHPVFIEKWRSYKAALSVLFDTEEEGTHNTKTFDKEEMTGILSIIRNAMENYDVDQADKTLLMLEGYDMPKNAEHLMDELKAAIAAVDSEKTAQAIDKICSVL